MSHEDIYSAWTRHYYGELDKVLGQNKAIYKPQDFRSFDTLNFGVEAKLRKFLSSIENLCNSVVIDLGSGMGPFARILAEEYQCRVHCIDPSEELNQINQRINQACGLENLITIHQATAEDFEFQLIQENIDLIISINVFHFIQDKQLVSEKLYNRLKSNGWMFLVDWNLDENAIENDREILFEKIGLMNNISIAQCVNILYRSQFSLRSVDYDPYYYTEHFYEGIEQYCKEKDYIISQYGQDVWDGRHSCYVYWAWKLAVVETKLQDDQIRQRFPLMIQENPDFFESRKKRNPVNITHYIAYKY